MKKVLFAHLAVILFALKATLHLKWKICANHWYFHYISLHAWFLYLFWSFMGWL